jgi:hypothetical protein
MMGELVELTRHMVAALTGKSVEELKQATSHAGGGTEAQRSMPGKA